MGNINANLFESARLYTEKNFKRKIKCITPEIEIIGKYINIKTPVKWKCTICGNTYEDKPIVLTDGKLCPHCFQPNSKQYKQRQNERLSKIISSVSPNIRISKVPTKINERTKCECMLCGEKFETDVIKLGYIESCPNCEKLRYAKSFTKTHEQFVLEMAQVNPNIKIVGQYMHDGEKIECECGRCKRRWFALPTNLRKSHGCPHCAKTQTSFFEKCLLGFIEKACGVESVSHRDKSAIGKELDIYIDSLKVAIEPGGWDWHKNKINEDKQKHVLCEQRGIKLITVYDNCPLEQPPFQSNSGVVMVYKQNFGAFNYKNDMVYCIKEVFNHIGIPYVFSTTEEESLIKSIKIESKRKSTETVRAELVKISPTVKLVGEFYDTTTPIKCSCSICGHEWESDYDHLIRRKQGCPVCYRERLQRKVRNVDTGEIFESIMAASKSVNLTHAAIRAACTGVVKKCHGYRWEYV